MRYSEKVKTSKYTGNCVIIIEWSMKYEATVEPIKLVQ